MSHPSKVKGNGFERELVDAAKEAGLDAKRAWGSNGAALGKHPEVDLVIEDWDIQAKRRKTLPAYLQIPECCDAVVFRQDRAESLVLITFREYLKIVGKLKQLDSSDTIKTNP